jgi:hypothetical protein
VNDGILAGKRIIPYGRASQLDGRTPEEALRQYEHDCERWAQGRPVTLLPFVGDVDTTGGKLHGRAGLDRVMEMIADGEADGVVTPLVSRFSRAGLRDALDRIEEIRLLGALFIPLDVPDAWDGNDLALNIRLSIAHDELRKQPQSWLRGKRRSAELGVHLGTAPVGYRHLKRPSPIRGGNGGRLEPDPGRFEMVQEAFQLAAEVGEHAAVEYLRAHPLGGEHWNSAIWRRTAERRLYLGETCCSERLAALARLNRSAALTVHGFTDSGFGVVKTTPAPATAARRSTPARIRATSARQSITAAAPTRRG